MAKITDNAFDAGLNYIRNAAEELHICSSEPANYAGLSAVTLGNVACTSSNIQAVADSAGGRHLTVDALSSGTITANGTGNNWALVDVTGTELLSSGSCTSPQTLNTANTLSTTAFDITFNDAT